jgi:hypothetical protein
MLVVIASSKYLKAHHLHRSAPSQESSEPQPVKRLIKPG